MSDRDPDADRAPGGSDRTGADTKRDNEPDLSTSPNSYRADDPSDRIIAAGVWLVGPGKYVVAGLGLVVAVIAAIAGVEVPRSAIYLGIPFAAAALLVGRPAGKKAMSLVGGPSLIYVVDVDLLDADGAGVFDIPSPRWSEWEVVDGSLWWATPNLAFGKNLDMEAQTIEGTWRGTLPDPVLLRSLQFIRYNREELEERAAIGDVFDLNGWSIIRKSVMRVARHIVRTYERGTLPDDNEVFRRQVDETLESFGIDPDGSFLDEFSEAEDLDDLAADDRQADQYLGRSDETEDWRKPTQEANADD